MKPFLLLLSLLVATGAHAGEFDDRLKELGFSLRTPPSEYPKYKSPTYGVLLKEGTLMVVESERVPNGLQNAIRAGGNKFDAEDHGEWGGSLIVTRITGDKKTLTHENTKGFLQHNGALYAFTGLAHLTMNTGVLYRIDSPDSAPRLSVVTLLPAAPMAVTQDEAYIYVVTFGDLVAIVPDEKGPGGAGTPCNCVA
jgi:hypothetical protein